MDSAIEAVLTAFDVRSEREWSSPGAAGGRDNMLLSVGRAAGELLNQLVRESGAKRILELGTSYGYSAIWLAEAARATGGKIISLDLADYNQAQAASASQIAE